MITVIVTTEEIVMTQASRKAIVCLWREGCRRKKEESFKKKKLVLKLLIILEEFVSPLRYREF